MPRLFLKLGDWHRLLFLRKSWTSKYDATSILGCVIVKGSDHGEKHGPTVQQSQTDDVDPRAGWRTYPLKPQGRHDWQGWNSRWNSSWTARPHCTCSYTQSLLVAHRTHLSFTLAQAQGCVRVIHSFIHTPWVIFLRSVALWRSLSPMSPLFLSSSTTRPDLLSPTPLTSGKDPRQDGSSTEHHSSTNYAERNVWWQATALPICFHGREIVHVCRNGADVVSDRMYLRAPIGGRCSHRSKGEQRWCRTVPTWQQSSKATVFRILVGAAHDMCLW